MFEAGDINRMFDVKVLDPHEAKVGTVRQVFVDAETGEALVASVSTGLFGLAETFVPLDGAQFDGENLRVRFDKGRVKDAPRIDAEGEMTEEQQEQIWDYYYGPARYAGEHAEEEGIGDSLTAVTESGEPGEQAVPRGRARLRKHLVVDEQSATVPGESGRA